MSSLKKQQKKLLTHEITARILEYLMGLDEKNEPSMRKTAEKSVRKLVKAYYQAIKTQHKSALSISSNEIPFVYEETTNLIAS